MSNIILPNCQFIHIPKCAGTAINHILVACGAVTDHRTQIIRKPHYGHLFPSQMPDDGKPRICFIRHPITWWQSWYHWNMNPAHSRFSSQELLTKSFNEWIKDYGQLWLGFYSTMARRYLGEDPNFPPSSRPPCLIGRVDNLQVDLARLLEAAGEHYYRHKYDACFSGTLLTDKVKHLNIQEYDRTAVSEESKAIIMSTESYMMHKFENV